VPLLERETLPATVDAVEPDLDAARAVRTNPDQTVYNAGE